MILRKTHQMNDRITKLALQANLTEVIDSAYQERNDWQPFVEKFAELIIQECANVAADHDALDIYEEIREHFGVEE
jgi:hypothetical protein